MKISRNDIERGLLVRTQLLPAERELFSRWFTRHGRNFDNFEFAVRFGPPAFDPTGLPESLQVWANTVARLRADFVAERDGRDWIFEMKLVVTPDAVGKLKSYLAWWPVEFPDRPAPQPAVIATEIPDYMREVLRREGIELFLI